MSDNVSFSAVSSSWVVFKQSNKDGEILVKQAE